MTFLYKWSARFFFIYPWSLSIFFSVFSPPKHIFLAQYFFPKSFLASRSIFFSWYVDFSLFLMHFISSNLTFGIFYKLWGFSKLMEFLWNFWDGPCENGFKSSCIASHLHYNNGSCILDVCLLCCYDCVLVGLNWAEPMMHLNLHVICSCIFMHTYLTFFFF